MSTQCTTPNCVDMTDSLCLRKRPVRRSQLVDGYSHTRAFAQRWLTPMVAFVVARYEQRMDRLAFQQLLKLDGHMLKDIGITRADVTYANNLPLSVDAAAEVNCIAKRNNRSRMRSS